MRYNWSDPSVRADALARPRRRDDAALREAVCAIVDDVRAHGWEALAEQALRIDGREPSP
ncbi:MAG: histidinol dehydrogenase, partial [Sphingomonas sp.]|nr:histidinol dehydrogenase [Sphingomonas sp.]